METIQLMINKNGIRKRLFFHPPKNSTVSLSEVLNDSVDDQDLSLSETIPLVIKQAGIAGFVVVPH